MPIPAYNPIELALKALDYLPKEALIDAIYEMARIGTTPIVPVNELLSILPF